MYPGMQPCSLSRLEFVTRCGHVSWDVSNELLEAIPLVF